MRKRCFDLLRRTSRRAVLKCGIAVCRATLVGLGALFRFTQGPLTNLSWHVVDWNNRLFSLLHDSASR